MGDSTKKTPAEEIIDSMLKDLGVIDLSDLTSAGEVALDGDELTSNNIEGLVLKDDGDPGFILTSDDANYESDFKTQFELTRKSDEPDGHLDGHLVEERDEDLTGAFKISIDENNDDLFSAMGIAGAQGSSEKKNKPLDIDHSTVVQSNVSLQAPEMMKIQKVQEIPKVPKIPEMPEIPKIFENQKVLSEPLASSEVKTEIMVQEALPANQESVVESIIPSMVSNTDLDKTVAVAGYQVRPESNYEDKVKISVGQNRTSSGYQAWAGVGSTDSNLAQAGTLQMAQEKIVELEAENEKLRQQNEELMAASEIIKERADLLSVQIIEYKNDRDGLEDSFNNEIQLLKGHLAKKDAELRRAQFKTEELDSRLKFDMKKVRIRERELENRLELIRAEKNAIVRNKDEQILDLRRKMDVLQMEVESYRQKCVDLNKVIESSQESFKRTTRALRLAMANLELQEENKTPLKKVD